MLCLSTLYVFRKNACEKTSDAPAGIEKNIIVVLQKHRNAFTKTLKWFSENVVMFFSPCSVLDLVVTFMSKLPPS